MAEREAEEAYGALLVWLREQNLEWLVEQIQDEVALGKTKSERITVEKESGGLVESLAPAIAGTRASPRSTSRSSAKFLARVEYSSFEKFEIAVGAVEAVVLGSVKIQDALVHLLGPSSSINFVPGETGESSHMVEIAALGGRRETVSHLTNNLKLLREDVHDADQTRSISSDN